MDILPSLKSALEDSSPHASLQPSSQQKSSTPDLTRLKSSSNQTSGHVTGEYGNSATSGNILQLREMSPSAEVQLQPQQSSSLSASFGTKLPNGGVNTGAGGAPCETGSMSAGTRSAQHSLPPFHVGSGGPMNPLNPPSSHTNNYYHTRSNSLPLDHRSQAPSASSGFTADSDTMNNSKNNNYGITRPEGESDERSDDSASHLPRFLPGSGLAHAAAKLNQNGGANKNGKLGAAGGGDTGRSGIHTYSSTGGRPLNPAGVDASTLPMHSIITIINSTANNTTSRPVIGVGRTNNTNTVHANNRDLDGGGSDDFIDFPVEVGGYGGIASLHQSSTLISPPASEGLFNSFTSKRRHQISGSVRHPSETSTLHSPSINNHDVFTRSTDSSAIVAKHTSNRKHKARVRRWYATSGVQNNSSQVDDFSETEMLEEHNNNGVHAASHGWGGRRVQASAVKRVWEDSKADLQNDNEHHPSRKASFNKNKKKMNSASSGTSTPPSDDDDYKTSKAKRHEGGGGGRRNSGSDGDISSNSCGSRIHDCCFSCFPCCYQSELAPTRSGAAGQQSSQTPAVSEVETVTSSATTTNKNQQKESTKKRAAPPRKRARNAFCGGSCCKIFAQLGFLVPLVSISLIVAVTIVCLVISIVFMTASIEEMIDQQRGIIIANQVLSIDAPIGIAEGAITALQQAVFSNGIDNTMQLTLGNTTIPDDAPNGGAYVKTSSLSYDPFSENSTNATLFAASKRWIYKTIVPSLTTHILSSNLHMNTMGLALVDGTYTAVRVLTSTAGPKNTNTQCDDDGSNLLMQRVVIIPKELKPEYNQETQTFQQLDGFLLFSNFSNSTFDPRTQRWYKGVSDLNPTFSAGFKTFQWAQVYSSFLLTQTDYEATSLIDLRGPLFGNNQDFIGVAFTALNVAMLQSIVASMPYLDQSIVLIQDESSLNVIASNVGSAVFGLSMAEYHNHPYAHLRSCRALANASRMLCWHKLQDVEHEDIKKLTGKITSLQAVMSTLDTRVADSSGLIDSTRYTFFDNVKGLAVAVARTQAGWLLVTTIPTATLLEEHITGRNLAIIITLFCLVVAVILIALVMGFVLLAPLRLVAARIIPVATFTDTALQRMPDSFIYEVSQITQSFNHLAEELAGARAFLPAALFPTGHDSKTLREILLEAGLDTQEESSEEGGATTVETTSVYTRDGTISLAMSTGGLLDNTPSADGGMRSGGFVSPGGRRSELTTANTVATSSNQLSSSLYDRTPSSLLLNTTTSLFSKKITVLMVNIKSFHKTVKGMASEEFLRHYSLLSSIIDSAVRTNRGVLTVVHGDRFMITFNASSSVAAHAERATLTALSIVTNISKANSVTGRLGGMRLTSTPDCERGGPKTPNAGDVPLSLPRTPSTIETPQPRSSVTCGFASGSAIIGNMGCLEMRRVGAVGPVVTRASILERLCKLYGSETSILTHGTAADAASKAAHTLSIDWALLPHPVQAPKGGLGGLAARPVSSGLTPLDSANKFNSRSDSHPSLRPKSIENSFYNTTTNLIFPHGGVGGGVISRRQSSSLSDASNRRSLITSVVAFKASATENWLAATTVSPRVPGGNIVVEDASKTPELSVDVEIAHDDTPTTLDLDFVVRTINRAFRRVFVTGDIRGAREVLQTEQFLRHFSLMHSKRSSFLDKQLGYTQQNYPTQNSGSPTERMKTVSPGLNLSGPHSAFPVSSWVANSVTTNGSDLLNTSPMNTQSASYPNLGNSGNQQQLVSSGRDLLRPLSTDPIYAEQQRRQSALIIPSAKALLPEKFAPTMRLLRSFLGPLPCDPFDSNLRGENHLQLRGSDFGSVNTPYHTNNAASFSNFKMTGVSVTSKTSNNNVNNHADHPCPNEAVIAVAASAGLAGDSSADEQVVGTKLATFSNSQHTSATATSHQQTFTSTSGMGGCIGANSTSSKSLPMGGGAGSFQSSLVANSHSTSQSDITIATKFAQQQKTGSASSTSRNGINPLTYVADYRSFFEVCILPVPTTGSIIPAPQHQHQ